MSIETLKEDLKANLSTLAVLKTLPSDDTTNTVILHLQDTLWPFLEAVVDELAEIDECVADVISGAEDILQPETAEIFAAIIAGAVAVSAALKARVNRETEAPLAKVIDELEKNCRAGEAIMAEIVIDTGDDDDGDADEDDEDDEGDDQP